MIGMAFVCKCRQCKVEPEAIPGSLPKSRRFAQVEARVSSFHVEQLDTPDFSRALNANCAFDPLIPQYQPHQFGIWGRNELPHDVLFSDAAAWQPAVEKSRTIGDRHAPGEPDSRSIPDMLYSTRNRYFRFATRRGQTIHRKPEAERTLSSARFFDSA
jgi:hypothetical protein